MFVPSNNNFSQEDPLQREVIHLLHTQFPHVNESTIQTLLEQSNYEKDQVLTVLQNMSHQEGTSMGNSSFAHSQPCNFSHTSPSMAPMNLSQQQSMVNSVMISPSMHASSSNLYPQNSMMGNNTQPYQYHFASTSSYPSMNVNPSIPNSMITATPVNNSTVPPYHFHDNMLSTSYCGPYCNPSFVNGNLMMSSNTLSSMPPISLSTRTNTDDTLMKPIKSITEKQPCQDWDLCKKTNDQDHVENFFHPCKFGTSCKNMNQPGHRNRYLHPCSQPQGKCTKLQDREHCTFFIHYRDDKPVTSTYTYPGAKDICISAMKCSKSSNRYHMVSYRHICREGEKCKELDSNQEHKNLFLHPCRFKSQCTQKNVKAHSRNFIHPCPEGSSCKKFLEGIDMMPHIVLFSHPVGSDSSNLVKYEWPQTWVTPPPPKLSKNPLEKPHFAKVKIASSTAEYQQVQQFFNKTITTTKTIISIERIENYLLWFRFCQKRKKMGSLHNETQLFHGTHLAYIDLIAEQGLDPRVSGSGKFGFAIYTSPYSRYSDTYASANNNNPKYIFVVRGLVGDTYTIPGITTMGSIKRPPVKPGSTTQLYDSVTGWNGQEIMFYDQTQVYPEYLITYN
ncbi:hypothetical protein C9374_003223 [Naegleria lovaniensis]|uniref:Poly [ADP-ribose] polymerase n=1 Tax=Naegleria lovaniensis TaxID=51637 RepID=A0AA88GUP8_NAELO|nr:uncharacterized protein C9374_003223 [Naegleria lovaniensis]KAG2386074.1 hypothetical protein C9374_003223 [Naegleria lovaniensis]